MADRIPPQKMQAQLHLMMTVGGKPIWSVQRKVKPELTHVMDAPEYEKGLEAAGVALSKEITEHKRKAEARAKQEAEARAKEETEA